MKLLQQAVARVRPAAFFHRVHPLNRPKKLLQVQSAFQGIVSPFRYSSNRTAVFPAMDPDINRTISFWFNGPTERWFRPPEEFDNEIRDSFGALISKARTNSLDSWADDARGGLALLLLLDQFPRNIYRGSDEAHASDAKACSVAVKAIAQGHDHQVDHLQALFFYLPLMHDEQLVSQIAGIALIENLAARCPPNSEAASFVNRSAGFAKGHRDVILKFGRYPSRNKVLGRESTEEEKKFLEQNPSGFFAE